MQVASVGFFWTTDTVTSFTERKGTTMLSVLAQDLTTSGSSDAASGGAIGVIVAISLIWLVISLAALWKIFVKMGEPGWKGIIPIYSQYVIFTKAGKPGGGG